MEYETTPFSTDIIIFSFCIALFAIITITIFLTILFISLNKMLNRLSGMRIILMKFLQCNFVKTLSNAYLVRVPTQQVVCVYSCLHYLADKVHILCLINMFLSDIIIYKKYYNRV